MNSASGRIFWFLMGGATFLLVAFLLRAPQEGTPSATSTDQSAPGSQPPPPTEPAEPHLEDGSREESGPEPQSAARGERARDSARAGSAEDPADSETGGDEAGGEPPPQKETLGTLSAEAVHAGVIPQFPAINECYSGWVSRNPDLGGKILVKFVIAASEEDPDLGYARDVEVAETTIDNVWLEGCVASAMEDAEFEAPSGGVVIVTYPFSFSSEPAEPVTEREAPPPL